MEEDWKGSRVEGKGCCIAGGIQAPLYTHSHHQTLSIRTVETVQLIDLVYKNPPRPKPNWHIQQANPHPSDPIAGSVLLGESGEHSPERAAYKKLAYIGYTASP